MHKAWIESMRYHEIPKDEWNTFYIWYCNVYPEGDKAISAAYEEWKDPNRWTVKNS